VVHVIPSTERVATVLKNGTMTKTPVFLLTATDSPPGLEPGKFREVHVIPLVDTMTTLNSVTAT
jgi:hypothetical protein